MNPIHVEDINVKDHILCYRGKMLELPNPMTGELILREDEKPRGMVYEVMAVDFPFMIVRIYDRGRPHDQTVRMTDFLWAKPNPEFLKFALEGQKGKSIRADKKDLPNQGEALDIAIQSFMNSDQSKSPPTQNVRELSPEESQEVNDLLNSLFKKGDDKQSL